MQTSEDSAAGSGAPVGTDAAAGTAGVGAGPTGSEQAGEPIIQAAPPGASVLETLVFNIALERWLIALAVTLVLFVVLLGVRRVLLRQARRLYETHKTGVAGLVLGLIIDTRGALAMAISLRIGTFSLALQPNDRIDRIIQYIVVILVAYQITVWGRRLVRYFIDQFVERHTVDEGKPDPALLTSMSLLHFIALVALYAIVVLMALSNLGIEVTPIIAGLGVGGIAIALAVQNILSDLFASLSIVLDKPFEVGDFIITGNELGTVERVGLKTTRVRSLSGEQLIFSNNDLLSSRIRNFKRMQQRRVVFGLGVTYQTPADKLELIPGIIKDAILHQEGQTRFDRAHFQKFGPSSLDFEAVYFVLSSDFNVYMDVQQAINLEILRRFAEEGVSFAYPTQTLFVESDRGITVRSAGTNGIAAGGRGSAAGAGSPYES